MIQDEVEAEVEDGKGLRFLTQPGHRLGQRLTLVIDHEGEERGQARLGGSKRRRLPVVVLRADVEMAVDEAGQDVTPARVDDAVGRRQELLGTDGGDLVALDGHGRLEDVGGGHDPPAADDGVDARSSSWAHRCGSFSVTG